MVAPRDIELAVARVVDQDSFVQGLLAQTLGWNIPEGVERIEDIAYGWTRDELRTSGLEKQLVEGQAWQIQAQTPSQPWGVFLLEFQSAAHFTHRGGLAGATGTLRKVLRGLVPSRRAQANLPQWGREHLLFICTHDYRQFRFAYFKAPRDAGRLAPLAAFGWNQGDTHLRTLCEHNLPHLAFPDDGGADPDAWVHQWASAFDVEAVTKRFFEEYRGVFEKVEASVGGVPAGEPRRLYTQRLFNRLMFLYFIQRKGWCSFQGDENYLRALFTASSKAKEDFLNDRLYWTFFAGLNTLMEDEALHSHVDLKERRGEVPFLNGGLFDLEDQYDERDRIKIPNGHFAAIFDLLDRYNFTVTESTPFDIEVAVDPEMLGKVFEELVTGRHESGSYYTPRTIVSFMCREALKHYLATNADGERGASAPCLTPPQHSDVQQHSSVQQGADAPRSPVARFVDDGDPTGLRNPEAVLDALRRVKVCDPACGSGAYLLGMMQELLRLREALFTTRGLDAVTLYARKLEIIQNNLYGVDLDLFAVNIAKLRLWLSLAVDFDGEKPPPLPNLDFKIECGDSLTAPNPQEGGDMWRRLLVESADQLAELKGQYIKAHGEEKKKLVHQIKELEANLEEQMPDHSPAGAIDWRVAFAEVFKSGGFDVVLGNPPYVRQEEIKAQKPALKKVYKCYTGVADLFVYFYERGIELLKTGGQFAFISSNKWYRSGYGEKLRTWLAARTRLHALIDFGDAPVFEAIAYPTIVLLERRPPAQDASFRALTWKPGPPIDEFAEIFRSRSFDVPQSSLDKSGWRLEGSTKRNLLDKLRAAGVPLGEYCKGRFYRGILTGLNEAFVVDRATRDRLITEDSKSAEIIRPFFRGRDVKRWVVQSSERYLIWTYIGVPIKQYPAILRHLKQFQNQLEKRQDQGNYWWELRACAYYDEFKKPKIIYPDIFQHQSFAYDPDNHLMVNTLYFMPEADLALLGILNSQLMEYYYARISNQIRGGYMRSFTQYIRELPIASPTRDLRSKVEKVLKLAKADGADSLAVREVEADIDEIVFDLYGISPEEVALM
jgi:type I restriction-modification system DNA methylase subunit